MSASFSRLAAVAWRESRTARRRLLLYMSSITLGVAALVAIDSFAENVTQSVHDQSRALLGGDLSLTSNAAFPAPVNTLFDSLSTHGTAVARQTSFASMALVVRTGLTRLSQVRAVTPGYPFYGQIETDPVSAWSTLQDGPHAIVDASLLVALNAKIGDSLSLGTTRFLITGTLTSVPGEIAVTAAIGPRIYIPARYLGETGLLVFGSRADYEALVKLPANVTPEEFEGRTARVLSRNRVRVHTAAENEYNLSNDIDQLRNFLSVVGLVALLLGGIGVASGVHAFVMRKIDTVAILRCLGATSSQVLVIYVLQAAAMGLVGAAGGVVLGVALQFAMPHVIGDFLPVSVNVQLAPAALLSGLAIGVWVALVFALRPLLALRGVSPLQALRRDADDAVMRRARHDSATYVVSFAIVASVFAIALERAERLRDGIGFSVAILVAVGTLWVVAALVTAVARRVVRPRWPFVLRHGVASLYRPGNQTRSVVLSLGFGVFLVSTLYQAQKNLLGQLNLRIDQVRANVVFFDVQGDEAPGVDSIIQAGHYTIEQKVPIVTMRIASINGETPDQLLADTLPARPTLPATADSQAAGGQGGRGGLFGGRGGRGGVGNGGPRRRPRWALQREYRSTYRDSLDPTEKLVAGTWFDAVKDTMPQVSLDARLADELGVVVGDTITWNVQGVQVRTRVTSLREVAWARFQPNFFVVFQPKALLHAPKQFVFLAYGPTPRDVAIMQRDVVLKYPNVSSLDLSLVQRTVADVLDRVTTAIRFMALVSLLLGVPVLFSAVAATRRERLREGVLFKTLGATRRQIGRIMLAEYALLGALGSLAGVLLSVGGAWALMHFIFQTPFHPAVWPALLVSLGMTVLAVAIGMLTSREVFASTPMAALRES
ncbi:MAG TPA: FtsX-like permease family protein [Gemmatimonadaceae bacterium]|nr:FtsX-like permease family protein [Gemmatimonadaceae bacterium]